MADEPIKPNSTYRGKGWGDLDPASGKVTGGYGDKYIGAITEDQSIITEANGFKNITTLGVGVSPEDYIERVLSKK